MSDKHAVIIELLRREQDKFGDSKASLIFDNI